VFLIRIVLLAMNDDIHHASPQPNVGDAVAGLGFSRRFWVLVVAAGVGIGLVGGGLMLLLQTVERLAWGLGGSGTLLDAVCRTGPTRRVGNLTVAGAWVAATGVLLRRAFGEKGGDVDSAIWFRSGRVPAAATLARAVQSIVAVGMGMSLGREAAIKQAGGAIASRLAGWADVPAEHRRLLVASGVGAGMAAAYNVPLGGSLFALEVLLGTVSLRLVLPAVTMSVLATATSWVALPRAPIYAMTTPTLTAAVTVWALVVGPVFGLVAVGLVRWVAWAGSVKRPGTAAGWVPVVGLAIVGVASIWLPQVLGNGQDAVQLAIDGRLTLGLLLVLPVAKGLATAGSLAAGGRGGLFTPTMMVGATAGGLLGHAWGAVWPGGVEPGLAGLIGAAAVLAAATQGPVSSIVLVLELTRHGDATMVPILLATLGATFTATRLERRSVYSARAPWGRNAGEG
jgi:H+/Cl- antiporter ClcA